MAEKYLGQNSKAGGSFPLTLAATTGAPATAASTPILSCLVWTPGALVRFNVGAAATVANALLPANAMIPMPYEDLADLNFFNGDAAEAIVHVIYRTAP